MSRKWICARTGRAGCTERRGLFFSLLFLCTLGLSACTGNGGSHDSGGAAYVPGGGGSGSGSSGTGGSVTGSGSNTGAISAEELRNLANSGRADSITALFPTGEDEATNTFFLNLSAKDFGVPDGGYMIFSIDSDGFPPGFGSHWENTQFASDVDGLLHFIDIPMVRVGSHVTVTLLCYTADGTLISSGYSSGEARENGVPMEISIIGSARIVLGSNSAPNGNTTEHDGVVYDIIEYTGSGLEMAAVNTTAASTMQVVLNGSVISTTTEQSFTAPLADGYNAIEVTVSKGSNEPIVVKRNIYVVKALTEDDVSITPSDYSTAAIEGDYEVLYFSYLADPLTMPNLSVGNEYTGDATTPELGNSYLEITVTGATTVAQTASLSGQELNLGDCTVSVSLCKPKCTPVSVEKKLRIKIKPVTVSMSSITLDYDTKDFHRWVTQSSYVQASNADGTDSTRKTVYEMNHVRYGADGWTPVKTVSVSAVLTAPDSSFRFWTTDGSFSYDDNPGEAPTSVGSYDRTWTLDDLRVTANRSVDQYVGVSRAASQYTFTLNVTD